MEVPETRYVAVGDADVAYQVVGDGPMDLLYCYGLGSHVELMWDVPAGAACLAGLATFSRLILFDRRGLGASDGISRTTLPTWEEWTEDITAVLDAVGSTRTAIVASIDAGPIAILFAAMHPELVSALILINTNARYLEADDYPIGAPPEAVDQLVGLLAAGWGTVEFVRLVNPNTADEEYIRLIAKTTRASTTPRNAASQYDYILRSLDVRHALASVQAPTLVVNVRDSPFVPVARGRYLADHIEGATFVEIPGGNLSFGADHVVVDEIAEFLTGDRPVVEVDRVLTTVLFTDIVGSTERAASVGDRRWNELLSAHHRAVRAELHRFKGREIDTAGDGFFASFDGPGRAIRCACAIREAVASLGLQVRAGLHTGEVEIFEDRLRGLAVHIGARVGAAAEPNEVLVSRPVADLVAGSEIKLSDRGEHELKGVPGSWRLFAVQG
jgi:class 3 adenylate cyclase